MAGAGQRWRRCQPEQARMVCPGCNGKARLLVRFAGCGTYAGSIQGNHVITTSSTDNFA